LTPLSFSFINKAAIKIMGIKRCPYCRALISEEDQYCKNCGTQLLFPEDEEIEEEIPGDKIIEDDRQGDMTEKLTEEDFKKCLDEAQEEKKEIAETTAEELEEFEESQEASRGGEAEKEEEVIVVEEETPEPEMKKETSEAETFSGTTTKTSTPEEILFAFKEEKLPFPQEKEAGKPETSSVLIETEDEALIEKIEKEVLGEQSAQALAKEELSAGGKKLGLVTQIVEELKSQPEAEEVNSEEEGNKPGLVTQLAQELGIEGASEEKKKVEEKTGESAITSERKTSDSEEETIPPTFKTEELEQIGPTVEVGKRQVEDFFKILEEKEKQRLKEKVSQLEKSETEETGEVPSWIKEVRTSDLKTGSRELIKPTTESPESEESGMIETGTGEEWLEEETASEPTMGFPEKVTRSQLEIEKEEEYLGEDEMELEEQIGEKEKTEKEYLYPESAEKAAIDRREVGRRELGEEKALPPLGFKNFVKAKIFDLLFIILFWLVSIWLAARSMNVTIFKLLGRATSGLLIFLLILTVFYFFLFYFFIGETLGDRLFREGEEEHF